MKESDRREYFRITGNIYLRITKPGDPELEAHVSDQSESLDPIAIDIMHFRKHLDYDYPDKYSELKRLTDIVEQMYSSFVNPERMAELPIFQRKMVNLSGSGMQFIYDEQFQSGEIICLHLSFPDYPFVTLDLEAEVRRSEKFGHNGLYSTSVSFDKINEHERDKIIRYVNYLQRQQANKSSEEI